MPTIIVRIPKGKPSSVTVQGMTGPGCKDLTKGLEKALGETTDDLTTREFASPNERRVSHDQDAS